MAHHHHSTPTKEWTSVSEEGEESETFQLGLLYVKKRKEWKERSKKKNNSEPCGLMIAESCPASSQIFMEQPEKRCPKGRVLQR